MLSRTAEGLYWIARYIERAETVARLLDVGDRMAMMPSEAGGYASEWSSVLAAAGVTEMFAEHYDAITERNVVSFLVFDRHNPSSIKNCIASARQNARSARTALTAEVWDTLNHTFLQFSDFERQERSKFNLGSFCDWTKRQSASIRGAFLNTQLQDEGFFFFHVGLYLERADNTARLLDVKYYILLPTVSMVGGGIDRYQWTTLLRAVSSQQAFQWLYGTDRSPRSIADYLILNPACPRSLMHCTDKIAHHLRLLSDIHGHESEALLCADRLREKLASNSVETIISGGLHEFLTMFIEQNARVGEDVMTSYLFGVA